MSDHTLPEDLSQWPDDPFALLGVERGIAPKDLKRCYTRLIKIYKPEHFPEHFRRIREAYEAVLRYVEMFGNVEWLAVPVEIVAPPPSSEVLPEPTVEAPAPLDDVAVLWETAIQGDDATAYAGLLRLFAENPSQKVCLRLYWLLSLNPDLDTQRKPCDWLVAGLQASGLHGPCLELYRREIEAESREAFTARFKRLLQIDSVGGAFAELVSWRWLAIRRTANWPALLEDLVSLRKRLSFDESSWLRLLLIACDGAAWIPSNDPYSSLWVMIQEEIQRLTHLGARHTEWFDRLDFLSAVREDWQKSSTMDALRDEPRDLVAQAWHMPFHLFQHSLLELLAQIDDEPDQWLDQFDELARSAPALLGAFSETLHQLEARIETPLPKPDAQRLSGLALELLSEIEGTVAHIRHLVLQYCVREFVAPEWLAEAILEGNIPSRTEEDERFAQFVLHDWPLRYTCWAVRLFWS